MTSIPSPVSRFTAVAPVVSTVARLVLGGVLIAAGALKVVDPREAVQAVRAYELVPEALSSVVGWGLPFVEIALGVLLVAGLFTRLTAGASGVLLLVFIAGIISAAARGLSIDCGCFGGGGLVAAGQTQYVREIMRDLGMLGLAGWLVWKPRSRFSLDRTDLEGLA